MVGCYFYKAIKWPWLLYYVIFNVGVWDWSISSILHLRFRVHQGRGEKTFCKNWKTRKSAARRRHLCMTEKATRMKSQQYGCRKKTWTIAMPVDIPTWMGEIPWDPCLDEELQTINDYWERISLPQGWALWLVIPNTKWPALITYAHEHQ